MTAASRSFDIEGPLKAPPWTWTGEIPAERTRRQDLKNVGQFLFLSNLGTVAVRVGFNGTADYGVDGDESANPERCTYFEVAAGGTLPWPTEFSRFYVKNTSASTAARVSIAVTLSPKKAPASDLTGTDHFDGVEELDASSYAEIDWS